MNSKTYHIKLNGKVYEVEIEEVTPGQKVQPESKVETKQEAKPQVQKTQATGGEYINAPMPGTITNILVNNGQNVRKGDVLAILDERASKEPARGLGPFQQEQGRAAEGLAARCKGSPC